MDYPASPIPYGSSHSVWSSMKFWAKIRNPALKGIICQNMQRVLKKFPINSEERKKYIETQEQKLIIDWIEIKKTFNYFNVIDSV